jgi:hypothetical protein
MVAGCDSNPASEPEKPPAGQEKPALRIDTTKTSKLDARSVILDTKASFNESAVLDEGLNYDLFISTSGYPDKLNSVDFHDDTFRTGHVYINKEDSIGVVINPIYQLQPDTEYNYRVLLRYKGEEFSTEVKQFKTKVESYEHGGIVYYDKGEYSDGWRYLVAAPPNWYDGEIDPKAEWGCDSVFVDTYFGTDGLINTKAINAADCNDSTESKPAYKLALNLEINGFDDWYLPSINELSKLYHSGKGGLVGGFSNETYWTSNAHAVDSLRAVLMIPWGAGDTGRKSVEHHVRPIRRY